MLENIKSHRLVLWWCQCLKFRTFVLVETYMHDNDMILLITEMENTYYMLYTYMIHTKFQLCNINEKI